MFLEYASITLRRGLKNGKFFNTSALFVISTGLLGRQSKGNFDRIVLSSRCLEIGNNII